MKPLRDFLLVRPEETLVDVGGEKKGEVVAVGQGKWKEGLFVPLEVNVGDKIRYVGGRKVDDLVLINEGDILVIEGD